MTKPKAVDKSKKDAGDPHKSVVEVNNDQRTMTRRRSTALNKSIIADNDLKVVQNAGTCKFDESGIDGDIEEDGSFEEKKRRRGRPRKIGRGGKTSASDSSREGEKNLKQERGLLTVLPKDAVEKLESKQTKKPDRKRTRERNQSSALGKNEENVEKNIGDGEEKAEETSECVMEPVYVQPQLAAFLKNNKLAVATQIHPSAPTVQSSTPDESLLPPLKLESLSPQELAKLLSIPPPPPPPPFIPTVQVMKKSSGKRPDRFRSSTMIEDKQPKSGHFNRKMPYETARKKLTYHQKQNLKMNRVLDAKLARMGISQDHKQQMMYQQPLSSQPFAPIYQAQQFPPSSAPSTQTMSAQPVLLQYPPQYPLQSYSAFPQPTYLFQSAAPPPNTQQPVLPPPYYYNNR